MQNFWAQMMGQAPQTQVGMHRIIPGFGAQQPPQMGHPRDPIPMPKPPGLGQPKPWDMQGPQFNPWGGYPPRR